MTNDLKSNLLPYSELSVFCEKFSLLISSGISQTEGIRLLLDDAAVGREKAYLNCILDKLEDNEPLYAALSACSVFPDYFINMVKIGEETGTLDRVLLSLNKSYEREDHLKKSIHNAVIYPAVMGIMLLVVVVVLIIKVVPIFNSVYTQLGSELTGFSKLLLNIGIGIRLYYIPLISIVGFIILLMVILFKTEKGKQLRMAFAYRTGLSRSLYDNISAMRIAEGLAYTIRSGMDPSYGFELAKQLNENKFFEEKCQNCQNMLSEGADLSDALFISKIFSTSYAKILLVASRTGSLDKALDKVAELYSELVNDQLNSRAAKIEPAFVIFLSVVSGGVLLSIMLPLVGILSGL